MCDYHFQLSTSIGVRAQSLRHIIEISKLQMGELGII